MIMKIPEKQMLSAVRDKYCSDLLSPSESEQFG